MNNPDVHALARKLDRYFVQTPTYIAFYDALRDAINQRRSDIAAGFVAEHDGFVLIGASGSGKTTLINRAITELAAPYRDAHLEIAQVIVPSPATLKELGRTICKTLGYPVTGVSTAPVIWDLVRFHAKARGTIMIHLDEAQDIVRSQSEKEWRSVINTLKSLQQNTDWPISLTLSGIPELADVVNHDAQLARRLKAFSIPKLDPITDHANIQAVIGKYCQLANVPPDPDVLSPGFIPRLIHAANYDLGRLTKLTQTALLTAVRNNTPQTLTPNHFTTAYQTKSNTLPAFNPFTATNYKDIDTTKLW